MTNIITNSTHRVEVVPVVLEPHPNADTLSVVHVWNYTVVVRTEDWLGKDRGAYIPPDSVVPRNEMFAFLGEKTRIGAKRLRGILSYGLLVPAPDGAQIGEDVAERIGVTHYGVTHYEPPLQLSKRQITVLTDVFAFMMDVCTAEVAQNGKRKAPRICGGARCGQRLRL